MCIYLNVSKTYSVIILTKDYSYVQNKEMTIKYMNRFAIEEDDQFEIHVKDQGDIHHRDIDQEDIYNAAEEVILKAQQGL